MINFLDPKNIHPDVGQYTISNDIIVMPLWTKEFCQEIINFCNQTNKYHFDEQYQTTETRLSHVDDENMTMTKQFGDMYKKYIIPVINKEWMVMDFDGLMTPFILKYTMNGSRSIRIHSDSSIVTFHMKLNDQFTDGEVVFPRQNLTNKDIEIGHAVLFPGMVTHPHYSNPITSGERYAFVSFSVHANWGNGPFLYNF